MHLMLLPQSPLVVCGVRRPFCAACRHTRACVCLLDCKQVRARLHAHGIIYIIVSTINLTIIVTITPIITIIVIVIITDVALFPTILATSPSMLSAHTHVC